MALTTRAQYLDFIKGMADGPFFQSSTAVSLLEISCRQALPTYYSSAVPSVSWWMLRENFLPISNSNFDGEHDLNRRAMWRCREREDHRRAHGQGRHRRPQPGRQ